MGGSNDDFQNSCLVGTRSTRSTVLGIVAHHQYLYRVDGLVAPQRDIDTKNEESTTTHDKLVLPATGEVYFALLPSQRKQNEDKLCWLWDPAVATNAWPHRLSHNYQVMVETSLVLYMPSLEERQFRPLLLCLRVETRP